MPGAVFVPARAEDLSLSFASGVDSAAQGSVLYRNNASRYTVLTPGTSGQSLLTQGAGANPVWGTPAVDLSPAAILAPGSSTRNLIQASGAFVDLVLKAPASGTPNLLDLQTSAGAINGSFLNDGRQLNASAAVANPDTTYNAEWRNGIAGEIRAALAYWANESMLTLYSPDSSNNFRCKASNTNATFSALKSMSFQADLATAGGRSISFNAKGGGDAISMLVFETELQIRQPTSPNSDFVRVRDSNLKDLWVVTSVGDLTFRRVSSTSSSRDVAKVQALFASSTDASRKGRGLLLASDASTDRECVRWETDGTNAMVGFLGAAAVARPTAYTQTYATATRTHNNVTSSAVATTAATLAAYGYTQAQADAIPVAINAIAADLLNLKQLVNSMIDDQQANGLWG